MFHRHQGPVQTQPHRLIGGAPGWVEGNTLHVEDLDVVDSTPLPDVKPYVPEFDARENVRTGWLEQNVHKVTGTRDDGRFEG